MSTDTRTIHLALSPRAGEALKDYIANGGQLADAAAHTSFIYPIFAELEAQLGGLPPEPSTPVAQPKAERIAEQMAAAGAAAVKAAA